MKDDDFRKQFDKEYEEFLLSEGIKLLTKNYNKPGIKLVK